MKVDIRGFVHDTRTNLWYINMWVDYCFLLSEPTDKTQIQKVIQEHSLKGEVSPVVPHHTHYDFDKSKIELI